jgi:poly(3-hydroxybutyrate) depolymerase
MIALFAMGCEKTGDRELMDAGDDYVPLSSGCQSTALVESGWMDIQSSGRARTYYLRIPEGYEPGVPMPVVMGIHGTGGSGENFLQDTYYNLQSAVGNEAILVYPNALAGDEGVGDGGVGDGGVGDGGIGDGGIGGSAIANWNQEVDTIFFDDMYAELESSLCFSTGQVFVTGHSSGGGFTSQIGCDRGNVIRAIAPVAGALLDDSACTGQVAVMQIQGANDTMVPPSTILPGKDYFVFYNGCTPDEEQATEGETPPCIEYANCDTGFPVQYCFHEESDPARGGGHAWPTFGGEAIWSFFKSLEPLKPTHDQGSGAGFASMSGITTTARFTVSYPADFNGEPGKIALGFYALGTRNPITETPPYILTRGDDVTEWEKGGQTEYEFDSVNLTYVPIPGDYTLVITMYLKGGTFPVPRWGTDYVGTVDVHVGNYEDPIVVEEPIPLEILRFY